jgi:hypothetical protein
MHLLLCSTNVNKLDTDEVGPIENRKPRADAANGSNDTQKRFLRKTELMTQNMTRS